MSTDDRKQTSARPAGAGVPSSKPSMEGEEDASSLFADIGDPGYGSTSDPLAKACRNDPELHAWCSSLHYLLSRHLDAVGLAHKYLATSNKDSSAAEKLVRNCRAIEEALRSLPVNRDTLLTAQQNASGRKAKLGGMCGMDAVIHVAAWLVSGLQAISMKSLPPPFRWKSPSAPVDLDWKRIAFQQELLATWIKTHLKRSLLRSVYGALRSDLATQAKRHSMSEGVQVAAPLQLAEDGKLSYADARAMLRRHDNQDAVITALEEDGSLKERSRWILQRLSEGVQVRQKNVQELLKGLTISEVGHFMRALVHLDMIRASPKYSRTKLGTLMMKGCALRPKKLTP